MLRCSSPAMTRRLAITGIASACALLAAGAQAQSATFAPRSGPVRKFPPQALRGDLIVADRRNAQLDGRQVQLAPAFKLYTQRNALIVASAVAGQRLLVNYVLEKSTGLVHAAWILTEAEAAEKRPHADNGLWVELLRIVR